jgi:hypothetical protein
LSNPFAGVRPAIAVLFLSVLAILLGGFIYDTARQTGQIEGERERARSESSAEAIALVGCKNKADARACVVEAREKQLEIRREEDAVRWQREAARSSWWAVALSIAQAIVGGAGLIAVLRSLRHSDDALKEARVANTIARQATEDELRAWVEIDFKFNSLASVALRPYIGGTAILKNMGATPAVDVSYFLGLAYDKSLATDVDNAITDFISGAITWSDEMLFPNAAVNREATAEHTGRPPPPGTLHVFMVAAYKTVFSEKVRITARSWDLRTRFDESGHIDWSHPPRITDLVITPSRIARAKAS